MNAASTTRTIALLAAALLPALLAYPEEDINALQYRLRSLQNLQSQGRYVDPGEISRLQSELARRADEIKKTNLRSQAIKEADLPESELDKLKEKATEYIQENAYDFIKEKVDERKAALAEQIKKAKNAREVAEYIERYTYSKDAPKNNPGLAKFYNDVYQEQGWIKRNLDRGIQEKQKELDRLSRFDTIDQGIERANEIKEQAEKKLEEYQQMIEGKIANTTGLNIEQLKEKAGQYSKYYEQVKGVYDYVSDLKGKADAAGESVPDIPEAAKQGLRNMVYIGEALQKAAEKAPPGISDMLEFYSNATQVSVKAAENAQKFKMGSGEIDAANQALGPWNGTLEQMGANQASITDFSKATGLRVLKADGGGYFIVDDEYNVINRKGLTEEQFQKMQSLYAGYEAVRKDGDAPLTPAELAQALAQAETGRPVVIRGEDFGKNADWLKWQQESALEREMRKEAAGDLYAGLKDQIPTSWGEKIFGRDDAAYEKDLEKLISRWSDYDADKMGQSRDDIEAAIRQGLSEGKSFDDIMKDLNGQVDERKAKEEEERKAKEEAQTEGEGEEDKATEPEEAEEAEEQEDGMSGEEAEPSEDDEQGEDSAETDAEEEDGASAEEPSETDPDAEAEGAESDEGMEEDESETDGDPEAESDTEPESETEEDQEDEPSEEAPPPSESGGQKPDEPTEADPDGPGEESESDEAPESGESEQPPSDLPPGIYGTGTEDDPYRDYEKMPQKWSEMTPEQQREFMEGAEPSAADAPPVQAPDPGSSGALDIFSSSRDSDRRDQTESSMSTMNLNTQMGEASRSGDQQARDARQIRRTGGQEARDIQEESTRTTAAGDRKDSWGNIIGEAVEEGIVEGGKKFGEALGEAAANKVSSEIFGPSGGKGEEVDSGSAAAGAAAAGTATSAGGGTLVTGASSGGSSGGSGGGSSGSRGESSSDDEEDDEEESSGTDDPIGLAGTTKNDDGTVTARYACGYSIRVKPPPPSQCPICAKSLESTTPNSSAPSEAPGVLAPPTNSTPPSTSYPSPPSPPQKKARCPNCKSTSIAVRPDANPIYGTVYRCSGCGNSFRSVFIVYE